MSDDGFLKLFVIVIMVITAILVGKLAYGAEIYTWTDPYGTVSFVDNKDKVPSKYPLTPFVFTQDKKWTVDASDTKASNQLRLDYLRLVNRSKEKVVPAPVVVIEEHFIRVKRHRSIRHGR